MGKVSWSVLLRKREVWGICAGKFIADPIWWFYLFWGAKFLNSKFGLNLKEIGLPFFSIYLISWIGGIFIGWLSSAFLKKGWSLNKGRKTGFLVCAIFALPVMLVPHLDNMWLAVALIALAAGGHCGWSANIFSLVSDIFPRRATASVTGIGGFAGAVGGAVIAQLVGRLLQNMGWRWILYSIHNCICRLFYCPGNNSFSDPNNKTCKHLIKMKSSERLDLSLNHKEPDRVPYDLAGTTVTGISKKAFLKAMKYRGFSEEYDRKEIDPIQQIVTPVEDTLATAELRYEKNRGTQNS